MPNKINESEASSSDAVKTEDSPLSAVQDALPVEEIMVECRTIREEIRLQVGMVVASGVDKQQCMVE